MLGVGFLFPLLDIADSTEYLYISRLIDDHGRKQFVERFKLIRYFVEEEEYFEAAKFLTRTVMSMSKPGEKTLFQLITGFEHQGSIAKRKLPKEVLAYWE
uniref:Putative serine carboxypeptidase n=1 Tax=Amblyomma americanum TaxID=6943 RepID=A0A0C9SEK8_AMBAM